MKKLILSSVIALALLSSCGGDGTKSKSDSATATMPANGETNVAAVKYQCPMKCEGEKTYDTAGKCPMCQMDMKEVK
ncbi:MAG: heavy metal-binding domain-containing protein [Bacteroidia bacterium]